jgi:hypothetical protein
VSTYFSKVLVVVVYMPVIPACKRQKWEDCKFENSVGYIVSSRAARLHSETQSEKKKKKKKNSTANIFYQKFFLLVWFPFSMKM